MTKSEAFRETRALERAGWADVQIMVSRGARHTVSFGVSAVDPMTGVRTGWRWNYDDRLSQDV